MYNMQQTDLLSYQQTDQPKLVLRISAGSDMISTILQNNPWALDAEIF